MEGVCKSTISNRYSCEGRLRKSKGVEWHLHSAFPDVSEYLEMKLPMCSQGREMCSSLERNRPWGSRGRIWRKMLSAGSVTSTWHHDCVLPVLRERLENWYQGLIPLLRIGYWSLIWSNPWLLPTSLLDVTPSEDIPTYLLWSVVPYVGGVEQGRKPKLCFLWLWDFGDTHT